MTTAFQESAYSHVAFTAGAADRVLEEGRGVVRLAPAWVPRAFCTPGRRIRLHPDDYYPFGPDRGGVDERWLSSAIRADNGPLTGPFEGLSLVVDPVGSLIPFDEFVAHHGADLIGRRLWEGSGHWPMYSKFFDNQQALPFHFHQRDEDAAKVGKVGKPEAYYYAPHMNNTLGDQPISFLGLHRVDGSGPSGWAFRVVATTASPTCRGATARQLGSGWLPGRCATPRICT
jgi:hypothetical protein